MIPEKLILSHCIAYDSNIFPNFYLPIFQKYDENSEYFIQEIDEFSGNISKFIRFDRDDQILIPIHPARIFFRGNRPAYVFVDRNSQIISGELNEIKSKLEDELKKTTNSSLMLQISELIGLRNERNVATKKLFLGIKELNGNLAATKFLRNASSDTLWRRIIKSSKSRSAYDDIKKLKLSILLTTDINSNTLVPQSIWNEIEDKITISKTQIIDEIRQDISWGIEQKTTETGNKNHEILETLKKISKMRNQTTRIIQIIRVIINNETHAQYILNNYRDKSSLANRSLVIISTLLKKNPGAPIGYIIGTAVGKIISRCFPDQRINMIMNLAEEFHDVGEIKREIERYVLKSESHHIVANYNEIFEKLHGN